MPKNVKNEKYLIEFIEAIGANLDEAQTSNLLKRLHDVVAEELKRVKNQRRIADNDSEKVSFPAVEVIPPEREASLPEWVRSGLAGSRVVGTSRQVVQTPDGRKFHLGNTLNELSGGEWTYFLNSVISTRFPTSGPESYAHHIRKIHPSPKPPQLMKSIIEFFTRSDEQVLDYFMGVGGTLLGASLAGRRAVGIDLSNEYVMAYKAAAAELGLPEQPTIVGDSLSILGDPSSHQTLLREEGFSLIAIDPPYGDMMSRRKTGESAKRGLDTSPTPFTKLDSDLGNQSIEEFFPNFTMSVEASMRLLSPGGHLVVFIKDLQPTETSSNLLHARIIEDLSKIKELRYLGLKIWADLGVNLYPYGYPYAFVPNQIHQYIMFFRKRR